MTTICAARLRPKPSINNTTFYSMTVQHCRAHAFHALRLRAAVGPGIRGLRHLMPLVLSFSRTRVALLLIVFVHATLPVHPTFPGTPLRKKNLAYVLVDSTFSEEAVQTVCKAAVRLNDDNSTARQTLKVVNVTGTEGACRVVDNSAVIHLTRVCLPNYASRLRPPILSIPGHQVHASGSLAHVSFGHGDISELPVLLAVASKLNWTSVVYVGDAKEDSPLLDRLLRRVRTFELSDVVPVREGVDPNSLYTRIADSDVDFVLVHCQSYFCYEIVKKLFYLRNEMTGQGSSVPWLMTESLTQNSQSGSAPGSLTVPSTTYGLQKALPNSPHSDLLLEDVSSLERSHRHCSTLEHCPSTVQQQLQVLDFYDSLAVLLHLIGHSRQATLQSPGSLVRFINEANLQGISGRIHFDKSSERTYPTLYNVLDISPFLVATIGVFDSSSSGWLHELRPLSEENSWRRGRYRRTMKKCPPATHTYRVTTMREPPFVIYDPDKKENAVHSDNYTGLVVEILDIISKEMGFTYKMSEPPDLKYGSINEQGEGNGMIGQLMNCDADLAAAAFAITSARSTYVHFTKPYLDVGKSLLAYKGESSSTSLWAFLNPFDFTTKLVIVASLAVVSVVFALLGKLSPYIRSSELETSTDGRERSAAPWPVNSFWFFYTTSMQQGPDSVPSLSGKILVAGWFFFCLVIVATYTANLAAFLTVKSFAGGVNSLDDLAAQTEVIYGTVRDTSIIEFFKNSPLDVHQKMYTYMITTPGALVDTADEAVRKVKYRTGGDYVFIWDEPILDYIASVKPCSSRVVGRAFNAQGYGLAMPQGMPYQLNFSLAILNMRETGVMEHLTDKWLQANQCGTTETVQDLTDAEEVRITDMLGVFVILASAVGASVLVAIIERVWWNLSRRRKVAISNGPEAVSTPEVFKAPKVVMTTARKRDSESESD